MDGRIISTGSKVREGTLFIGKGGGRGGGGGGGESVGWGFRGEGHQWNFGVMGEGRGFKIFESQGRVMLLDTENIGALQNF